MIKRLFLHLVPAISPLVPSRLILNLSPAEAWKGGHHTVAGWAASCNSIQLQFVSKLVRLSPQPPTNRTKATDHRPLLPLSPAPVMSMPSSSYCLFRNQPPPPKTIGSKTARSLCWHAALGMKCFTCGATGSPALPLSPPALGCLHGISQAAPRPNMHCHRRPCPIPMAS